eukprot:scaffold2192_cov268-Chaetoceros_neogracile.AAC.42
MNQSSSTDDADGTAAVVQSIGSEESFASENAQEESSTYSLQNAVTERVEQTLDTLQNYDNHETLEEGFHDAIQKSNELIADIGVVPSPELSIDQAAPEADPVVNEEMHGMDNDSEGQVVEDAKDHIEDGASSSSEDFHINDVSLKEEENDDARKISNVETSSYVPPTLDYHGSAESIAKAESNTVISNDATDVLDDVQDEEETALARSAEEDPLAIDASDMIEERKTDVEEEEHREATENPSYKAPIIATQDLDVDPKTPRSDDLIETEAERRVAVTATTAIGRDESNPVSPRSYTTEESSSIRSVNQLDDRSVTRIRCYVNPSTPIPHSDSSLRLLRKFITKTSKYFPASCGGTKSASILSFLFGASSYKDESCTAYKALVDILLSGIGEEDDNTNEIHTTDEKNDAAVIESILGHSGDTMLKARSAIACFCQLMEIWCLETIRLSIVQMSGDIEDFEDLVNKSKFHSFDGMDLGYIQSRSTFITGEVMTAALICAEGLVAHGCFDGVLLGIGEEDNTMHLRSDTMSISNEDDETYVSAISVLCESIYNCFLETEAVELATLKFLLTSGCRTITCRIDEGTEAMLQGTHLLQAIRVCYRLYLSTDSAPNKTTAKAALRQIVTSTFKRLESEDKTDERPCIKKDGSIRMTFTGEGEDPFSHAGYEDEDLHLNKYETDDKSRFSAAGNFPSFEHKDAYLVLRSLCKLSMKAISTKPEVTSYLSTPVVISRNESSGAGDNVNNNRSSSEFPSLPILMDPALDSKILALDLILEILQRTKTEIFMNAGPHLIYAVRNYLCHSLLKNCTSDNTYVVSLSLQLFVPLFRHFRSHLKPEIEAFVTNVFFVILDSKNSTVEHKLRVVVLFEEICSDSATLAEIFLNYDCDLSAVDLFQRIVNTLARVAKIDLHDQGMESTGLFVGNTGAIRAEKTRQDHRALRLEAMKAVRKILASLYVSIAASPMGKKNAVADDEQTTSSSASKLSARSEGRVKVQHILIGTEPEEKQSSGDAASGVEKQSLVQIYDSKKKRKEDFAKVILKFNQKPKAGIKLAAEVGFLNEEDPSDVAQFLLAHKDSLDKTQTGEFLGMEAEYKGGFMLKVLNQYANGMDFAGLQFDDAIKMYLGGFRLPGEAQKVRYNNNSLWSLCIMFTF